MVGRGGSQRGDFVGDTGVQVQMIFWGVTVMKKRGA